MDLKKKYTLYTLLVIILLVANATSITMYWVGNKKQSESNYKKDLSPAKLMILELKLNEEQQKQLEELRVEHGFNITPLYEKHKKQKKILYNLLKLETVSDSAKKTAIENVTATAQQIDYATFDHFRKIRAICTPEQQTRFNEILEQVIYKMTHPKRGGPRLEDDKRNGPPPPREDGPENWPPPPPRD